MSEIKYQPFLKVAKDITSKFTKIKKQDYLKNGKYTIIDQSQNFIAGYTNNIQQVNNFNENVIIFGDHTRIIKYIDFPIAIGADGVKVLKINEEIADTKYIYYFLKSVKLHNAGYSRHFKYLKALKIPIQPLENQRKISTILTQIEALIQKREDSIKLLDELIKSTFLDMFQNVLTRKTLLTFYSFNEFCTIDTNMVDDFIKYSEYPHIGISSIEKNTGKILDYKLVKDENLVSGKYLFDERHILYSKIRPNLNKVALPDFKGLLSADAYPILPNNDLVTKEFLAYLLRSEFFLNYILAHSDRANIPKVNKKALFGFKCNIPDIALQEKFSNIVKQVEVSKIVYQESLKELNQLFNSTAQKAFKGELDLSKINIEQRQEKEALKMLDKEQLLELIKQGDFDPKEHVNAEQSYDDIRDMIIGTKDKKGLIDDGLAVQEFDEELKKMLLKAVQ